MPIQPIRRRARLSPFASFLLVPLVLLVATSTAFAQVVAPPGAGQALSALTPPVIFTAALAMLVAFLAEGVNTGKIGSLSVPTSWIPKLSVAFAFVAPFFASDKAAADPLSALALTNALQAGIFGLLGGAGGVALLGHTTAHMTMRKKVEPTANDLGTQRGMIELRALLVALILVVAAVGASLAVMVGIAACSPSQQKTVGVVENGIFSADQVACIVANAGFMGDSNAVQEFEQTCNIAPALEGPLSQFIGILIGDPTTAAKLKASGLRKGSGP